MQDGVDHLPLDRGTRIAPQIAGLDRKGAAGAFDHRRIVQQAGDMRGIERRRHDDQPEILAQPGLHVAGERQAEIGVERAFVELVEQQGRDAVEPGILEHPAREHALGDDLDAGRPRYLGAEAHPIADGLADLFSKRHRHAAGGGAGGEPARLEHDDLAAARPRLLREHQRHPRGLAGARRRHQDRDIARAQSRGELGQHRVDGQGLVEFHTGLVPCPDLPRAPSIFS